MIYTKTIHIKAKKRNFLVKKEKILRTSKKK